MIGRLLPLTKNKLEILKYIYEKNEAHLLDIAKNLKIHPYSAQKTLNSLSKFLGKKKAGRTITLFLDKNLIDYFELIYFIEDYKLEVKNKDLKLLIKNLKEFFSKDRNVLSCVLFGSFARGVVGKDIDLLFVIKSKDKEIIDRCSQISTLLNKEISPLIMTEKEFIVVLKTREPTIVSVLEPSQRLLIIGKEFFLRYSYKNMR